MKISYGLSISFDDPKTTKPILATIAGRKLQIKVEHLSLEGLTVEQ